MESAAENNGLTRCENSDLIEQTARLHWNDSTKVVDVIWVLQTVADKICALTDYRLAYFTWSLAGDNEGQTELASLFGNSLERQS